MGLLIAQAFAQRCLLVARRKLAIKQARERRAATHQHGHPIPGEPVAGTASRPVDLVTIDVQTRRLLRSFINVALIAGCWLIWIDVLPALGILDRCQLWKPVASEEWITLGDVALCGVIVLMTFAAGRNLPGLLEIAFLQRLPMDPGGALRNHDRFALSNHTGGPLRGVLDDWHRLVERAVAGRRHDGRFGLWFAERSLPISSSGFDHLVRAPGTRGRYGYHWRRHRLGLKDSHSCHHCY